MQDMTTSPTNPATQMSRTVLRPPTSAMAAAAAGLAPSVGRHRLYLSLGYRPQGPRRPPIRPAHYPKLVPGSRTSPTPARSCIPLHTALHQVQSVKQVRTKSSLPDGRPLAETAGGRVHCTVQRNRGPLHYLKSNSQ